MTPPRPAGWRSAALGALFAALGAALFGWRKASSAAGGSTASARPRPTPKGPAPKAGTRYRPKPVRSRDRTTKRREAVRTLHWPPRDPGQDAAPGAAEEKGPAETVVADPTSLRLGYEVRDTRVDALGRTMAIGVAAIAIGTVAMFVMIGHFQRGAARPLPLTPQQAATIVPPGPRLQDHPFADIAAETKREAELLESYAYIDAGRQRARIPIARAMSIVTGRPLDPPR